MTSTWKRLKGLPGRLLLLAVATAVALLAAEALVRWLAPQQLIRLRPDVWTPDHEGLGWRMAPDLDTVVNTGERDVVLRTDADGHRVGAPSAPASRQILALGDSFLAAIEVGYADTMTARLEESVSATLGERVRIVNAGVAGWDPNHYLLELRRELARRDYDLVLVFVFRGNDIVARRQDVIPPKQGQVVHYLRWPRSLAPRELRKAWLYPVNDFLERRSHLFILVRQRSWHLLMRIGLSARRFPVVELRSEATSQRWRVTADLCADAAAEAGGHGIETLFVLLPGAYHVDPELGLAYAATVGFGPDEVDLEQSSRILTAELLKQGLRFVDLTTPLREARAAGVRTHGEIDTHLSPAGHAAVARELHESVLELLRATSTQGSHPG